MCVFGEGGLDGVCVCVFLCVCLQACSAMCVYASGFCLHQKRREDILRSLDWPIVVPKEKINLTPLNIQDGVHFLFPENNLDACLTAVPHTLAC